MCGADWGVIAFLRPLRPDFRGGDLAGFEPRVPFSGRGDEARGVRFSVGITREFENRARPVWARFLRCTTSGYRAPSRRKPGPLSSSPRPAFGWLWFTGFLSTCNTAPNRQHVVYRSQLCRKWNKTNICKTNFFCNAWLHCQTWLLQSRQQVRRV